MNILDIFKQEIPAYWADITGGALNPETKPYYDWRQEQTDRTNQMLNEPLGSDAQVRYAMEQGEGVFNPAFPAMGLLGTTKLGQSFKNKDVQRAANFLDRKGVDFVNPATDEIVDLSRMSKSDEAQVRNYGKALKNKNMRIREGLRADGGLKTVISKNPEGNWLRKEMPVDQLENKVAVPIMTDLTTEGDYIRKIGGVKLPKGSRSWGGVGYSHAPHSLGHAYASTAGATQGIQNRLSKAANDTGLDPVWAIGAMDNQALNFAHFPMDGVLQYIDTLKGAGLSDGLLNRFSKDIRSMADVERWNKAKQRYDKPYAFARDFVGFNDPAVRQQLIPDDDVTGAGALRKLIMERMMMPKWQNEGMPHYRDIQKAYTEPDFWDLPVGATGLGFLEGIPNAPILDSLHATYPKAMQGVSLGGFRNPSLPETFWQGILKGKPYDGNAHSALSKNHSYQIMTPEIIDAIGKEQEMFSLLRSQGVNPYKP